jgi:hypothetical protein
MAFCPSRPETPARPRCFGYLPAPQAHETPPLSFGRSPRSASVSFRADFSETSDATWSSSWPWSASLSCSWSWSNSPVDSDTEKEDCSLPQGHGQASGSKAASPHLGQPQPRQRTAEPQAQGHCRSLACSRPFPATCQPCPPCFGHPSWRTLGSSHARTSWHGSQHSQRTTTSP